MHYKKPGIQKLIAEHSYRKEIAIKFGDKGFGKRPDTIQYPSDVLELAKQGATSFHASEELWNNPLSLNTGMRKEETDQLRSGWDLVLDIDCKILEYSSIAADLLVKALRHHGVRSISVKFSGNHGFHIGVPFEAFPMRMQGTETRLLFPEAPKKIALYLKEMISRHLGEQILKKDSMENIMKKTGKSFKEIVRGGVLNPFSFLEIDTLLISSRHLYRMPYCFNEKSGLVSVPVEPDRILDFSTESAKPENVRPSDLVFLDRSSAESNEAERLIIQAFDHAREKEKEAENALAKDSRDKRTGNFDDFETLQEAIPEELFPPCIKIGLQGLKDGRKRFLFSLINFLKSAGWDYDMIEKRIGGWNRKNKEELRENVTKGQVRYHKQQNKNMLPPNCSNNAYYKDMGICRPDHLCGRIKNPVNYAKRRALHMNRQTKTRKGNNPKIQGRKTAGTKKQKETSKRRPE